MSNKKEKKRFKREEKRKKREKERRMATIRRISFWVLIFTIAVGGIWYARQSSTVEGVDPAQFYQSQSRDHVALGEMHPAYNSNPPTSGWHAQPVTDKVSKNEVLDENAVHNLEHGHVWISYQSDISKEAIETLESFANDWVFVSPRDKNDSDVALAAWQWLDTFDIPPEGLDMERIEHFIDRHGKNAPEYVPISAFR